MSTRKQTVRLGIIGVGGMGSHHARSILQNNIPRCTLAAVCDINPERLRQFDAMPEIQQFDDSRTLIRSGAVDAVLIATPHYAHTTIGIDALNLGLHVLVEKPISVHKADCEKLIAAHSSKKQVFCAMFNQRTQPCYQKVKQLIESGELGTLVRVNWIITDWFRSEAYYAQGGWRATWGGEGGGVLLNQSPHQLDLLQWLCGMPTKVRAFCHLGKYHDIEVEDEVTAYFEYPGGATGVFITSTGEAPGTNRLEICGDRGKIVIERYQLSFIRNEVPASEFGRATKELFATPQVWNIDIPVQRGAGEHNKILTNFTDAILDGTPLLAPAEEGIHSVELANAMLYSSLTGKPVEVPIDGAAFARMLKKLIKESTFKKKVKKPARNVDMTTSFR